MSHLPRWMAEATRPTDAELAAVVPEPDPRLGLARRATAPRIGEVERLLARRTAVAPRRTPSILWLAAPVAAALAVLFARDVLPGAADRVSGPDGAVHALVVGSPEELVPGVFVDGRGRARVVGDAIELEGVYRVVATVEVALVVRGVSLVVEPGEVHVADDALAVVRGTVRTPDGQFLVSGDRTVLGAGVVTSAASPVAPPIALPSEPPPRPPPVGAKVRRPSPPPPAPAPVEIAAPPVAEPPPAALAPVQRDAALDWRALLDARDAGLGGRDLARRYEAHVADWPQSPFAAEARALAVLTWVEVEAPGPALVRVDRHLASWPGGPRTGELHAAGARIARDALNDCARALPHDLWIGNLGPKDGRPAAQALAGLCELHLGRPEGADRLRRLDVSRLEPGLAKAVAAALETP